MDWKLLITENVGCQNIRCHELQAGDKLQELITDFQETNAKAVVLINTSNDYSLNRPILAGTKRSSFPVVVLTRSDGMKLLNIVEQHKGNMLAKISVERIVDRPVQMKKPENGSSSAPQEQGQCAQGSSVTTIVGIRPSLIHCVHVIPCPLIACFLCMQTISIHE